VKEKVLDTAAQLKDKMTLKEGETIVDRAVELKDEATHKVEELKDTVMHKAGELREKDVGTIAKDVLSTLKEKVYII